MAKRTPEEHGKATQKLVGKLIAARLAKAATGHNDPGQHAEHEGRNLNKDQ